MKKLVLTEAQKTALDKLKERLKLKNPGLNKIFKPGKIAEKAKEAK